MQAVQLVENGPKHYEHMGSQLMQRLPEGATWGYVPVVQVCKHVLFYKKTAVTPLMVRHLVQLVLIIEHVAHWGAQATQRLFEP